MKLHKDPEIRKIQERCKELAEERRKQKPVEDQKIFDENLRILNAPLTL